MEKDATGSDHLGSIAPLKWSDLCGFMGTVKRDVEIFNTKNQVIGNITF